MESQSYRSLECADGASLTHPIDRLTPAQPTAEDAQVEMVVDAMEPGIYGIKNLLAIITDKEKLRPAEVTRYVRAINKDERITRMPFTSNPYFRVMPNPESPAGRNHIQLEKSVDGAVRELYGEYGVSAFKPKIFYEKVGIGESRDGRQRARYRAIIDTHPQFRTFGHCTAAHIFPPTLTQAWPEGPQTIAEYIAELAAAHHYPGVRKFGWITRRIHGETAIAACNSNERMLLENVVESAIDANDSYIPLASQRCIAYEILRADGSGQEELLLLKIGLEKAISTMPGAVFKKIDLFTRLRQLGTDVSEWRKEALRTYIDAHPLLVQIEGSPEKTKLAK